MGDTYLFMSNRMEGYVGCYPIRPGEGSQYIKDARNKAFNAGKSQIVATGRQTGRPAHELRGLTVGKSRIAHGAGHG